MAMASPLPVRDGVGATRLHLPMSGSWPTVGAFMSERFFHMDPDQLMARFDRGEIVASDGSALARETPLGVHEFVWYYREPPAEAEIPFEVEILHQDRDLVVVDKPHFLPTTPGGRYVQNSALVRLRRLLDLPDLAPIHRLDRATAGLLMFAGLTCGVGGSGSEGSVQPAAPAARQRTATSDARPAAARQSTGY